MENLQYKVKKARNQHKIPIHCTAERTNCKAWTIPADYLKFSVQIYYKGILIKKEFPWTDAFNISMPLVPLTVLCRLQFQMYVALYWIESFAFDCVCVARPQYFN